MKILKHSLILLVFITSCGKEAEPTVEGTKEFASYDIVIEGSEGGPHHLIGEKVDSRWRSSDGYIWLGTDERNLPTGTITIYLSEVHSSGTSATVEDALVSKSDVLISTYPDEAKARTFTILPGNELFASGIDSIEIGSNYISAKIQFVMERIRNFPDDEEEIVTVKGTFVAISQ
jgi:hypothetical protein